MSEKLTKKPTNYKQDTVLHSPSGYRYALEVDDSGNISTKLVEEVSGDADIDA
ncbi:hypothetical protein K0T92_14460 [Paenibacillus oenotherae]|uniref:Uncharacterized protein n=1 Tax=Paenibacillus oenotherae TaxID=1435645 RepID=A0ABS7D7T8_9BACL|nr:hypothetical protein [Paenibacillus oenotherae]MBW7475945.1 hypothetical protein [Paenibacillus oenotherae]